jgi:copper chaperone
MEYKFKVAMTCGGIQFLLTQGCSGAVQRILTKAQGVDKFDINLEERTVTVESASLSQDDVMQIIKKSGKDTEVF